MAGDIVLQAALDNPKTVTGLVGVDNFKNVGHRQTAQNKKDFADAIKMLKHNFKAVAFGYFNEDLFSKTTDSTIRKKVLNDVAHADTTIAIATMVAGNDFYEIAKVRAVKTKLYLINSDVHPTDTAGLISNKIPFRVFYVHGTGHFPMVEDPKAFNLCLEQIITAINSDH